MQVGLFPSVHRLFDQVDGLDAAAGAQELAHLLFQLLFRLVVEGIRILLMRIILFSLPYIIKSNP